MRKLSRDNLILLFGICFFIILFSLTCILFIHNYYLISTIILIIYIFVWTFSIKDRIVDMKIRKSIFFILIFSIFWLIIKMSILLINSTWYLYIYRILLNLNYIPSLGILFVLFYIQYYIDNIELSIGNHFYFEKISIYIISSITLLLIIVYDNYRLLYRYNIEFENKYTNVYYIILSLIVLLFVFTIIWIISCISNKKSNNIIKSIPIFMLLIKVLLSVLNIRIKIDDIFLISFPDIFILMTILYIEINIQLGIIHSNSNYKNIFVNSSIPIIISDKNKQMVFSSGSQELFNNYQIDKQNKNHNYRFHEKTINGGFVSWIDDVTKINEIKSELSDTNKQLSESVEIVLAENKLKKDSAQYYTQNRLYDDIANDIKPWQNKIYDLIKNDGPDFDNRLAKACVLNVFIKRFSNLKLISYKDAKISTYELYLSIMESIEYLHLLNIDGSVYNDESCDIKSIDIINSFEIYEDIIEKLFVYLLNVFININVENKKLKMKFVLHCNCNDLYSVCVNELYMYDYIIEDDILYITYYPESNGEIL